MWNHAWPYVITHPGGVLNAKLFWSQGWEILNDSHRRELFFSLQTSVVIPVENTALRTPRSLLLEVESDQNHCRSTEEAGAPVFPLPAKLIQTGADKGSDKLDALSLCFG